MAYDFKKEAKMFYMPKNKPEIVTVPPMNFLAVRNMPLILETADESRWAEEIAELKRFSEE